uniref:Uncharacterized protein n=1 Tax=Rhizophora mucronata TaxID=61149 RepID=A0A2P2N7J8_RHIMU
MCSLSHFGLLSAFLQF